MNFRRLVGTWVSESTTTNITTLHLDGRCETRFLLGVKEVDAISGRWRVEKDALVWTYAGKGGAPEDDVNPIVSD